MTETRPKTRRLSRRSYATDAATLAQRLIGCVLVTQIDGVRTAGRIVETEAYLGPEDKAAHAVAWRRTPRTEPMFGPPGTAYVFLTYGMHHCFNAVCGEEGFPTAVLVRALEPLEGLNTMAERRARPVARRPLRPTDLCSGPAKLCRALAIDRSHTAQDLTRHPDLWIEPRGNRLLRPEDLVNTTRIGVDYAGAWAQAPLRWYLRDSPHVSVRAPADKARSAGSRA